MLAAVALAAAAASAAVPPAPTRWVEDHAGLLSPAARDALDGKLEAYGHATGHQVVVWIGRTLDGAPLADWAVRTFAAWKIGRKGSDDGIAIFILADDRAIDIEVGYGLEDKVPDAIASRIIREVMAPRLRAGDRDGAVAAGVDAVLAAIEGHPWTAGASSASETRRWEGLGFAVLAVIVLIVFLVNPRLALWLIAMTIGRGGIGGGGGGGGFGGGGGRSGGGGARGGW